MLSDTDSVSCPVCGSGVTRHTFGKIGPICMYRCGTCNTEWDESKRGAYASATQAENDELRAYLAAKNRQLDETIAAADKRFAEQQSQIETLKAANRRDYARIGELAIQQSEGLGENEALAKENIQLREINAANVRNMGQTIYTLDQQVAKLHQWVSDLQSGMYVNCVYCGHRYGPGETPVSMADALKVHVAQCPEHPMSALKSSLEELLGLWEVAAVMPEAIGKALTLKMDSPELDRARKALAALVPP